MAQTRFFLPESVLISGLVSFPRLNGFYIFLDFYPNFSIFWSKVLAIPRAKWLVGKIAVRTVSYGLGKWLIRARVLCQPYNKNVYTLLDSQLACLVLISRGRNVSSSRLLVMTTSLNYQCSVQAAKWSPAPKWSVNWTRNDPGPEMIPNWTWNNPR